MAFRCPSVFVVQRSRGKIAEALDLDAVVDDRPENCLDVALDSKAKPILIWPGDHEEGAARRRPPVGVRRALNFATRLDLLIKIDDEKNGRGVVRSTQKLFGKETTRDLSRDCARPARTGGRTHRYRTRRRRGLRRKPADARGRYRRCRTRPSSRPPSCCAFSDAIAADIAQTAAVDDHGDLDPHRAHAEYAFRASALRRGGRPGLRCQPAARVDGLGVSTAGVAGAARSRDSLATSTLSDCRGLQRG